MTALYQTERPRTWGELVGMDRIIKVIDHLRATGLSGRCYFISGASGTGKTTIARLIAAEVADDWATVEVDGSQLDTALCDEIESARNRRPLGRGHCFIVNEAHGIDPRRFTRLLQVTEDLPAWVTIIFTTTSEAKKDLFDERLDAHPLLSRCEELALPRRDLARPFAERAKAIAERRGLDGQPLDRYIRLAQECRNNLREMLGRIGRGEMAGGQ